MSGWLSVLNSLAGGWAEAMARASWQGGLALGLVWVVCRLVPRLPPGLQCWLWRIAYLKVLVALFWTSPVDLPLLPPHPATSLLQPGLAGEPSTSLFVHSAPTSTALSSITAPFAAARPPDQPLSRQPGPRPGWQLGLLLAWLVGAAWHLGQLAQQWRRIALLRRNCEPSRDTMRLLLAPLCHRLNLRCSPELLIAPVPGPFVVGVLRPAIVLPTDLQVTVAEREWILAHELAHVKRRDLWWSHLPVFTRVLFFFHPLVWLAHREWRLAQETACDALTVRITSARACDYGDLLVRLASRHPGAPDAGLSAAGIQDGGATLERRLKVLRSISNPTRTRTLCGGVLMALTLGGLVPWRVSAQASASTTPAVPSKRGSTATSAPSAAAPAITAPAVPAPTARYTSPAAPPELRATAPATTPALTPPVSASAASNGPRMAAIRPAAAVSPRSAATRKPVPAKPAVKVPAKGTSAKKAAAHPAPAPSAAPPIIDPGLLQAAGINVGPYGSLIAALTPAELLQYVATERRAAVLMREIAEARYKNGTTSGSEVVSLQTKAAQLDILVRAAERLAQAPAAPRRADLYSALTPAELLQFLQAELQGARSLRDMVQAQVNAGVAPNADLLPLETRTQQLEILARAAERRIGTHE